MTDERFLPGDPKDIKTDRYDLLVIAGTADSRMLIEEELKKGKKILASVATGLGRDMLSDYPVDVHVGRLDREGFVRLLTDHPADRVLDASHPFARIVTETVREACRETGIPYERRSRSLIDYDYDRIIPADDVAEAVDILNKTEDIILLTTGVNTARAYYEGVTEAARRLYIRVLDTEASHEGCRKAGYPDDHVFGEMPPFSLEDNLRLIRQTGAGVLVSKDSGKAGGVDVKVRACKEAGIPMILIRRPDEPPRSSRGTVRTIPDGIPSG